MSTDTHTIASYEWRFDGDTTIPDFMSVRFADTAYDFGNIVREAMSRIERVILTGELFTAAEEYLRTERIGGDRIRTNGFDYVEMAKYMKYGEFKYTRSNPLQIRSIGDPDVYGKAEINGNWIGLNAAVLTHTGHGHFRGNAGKLAALTGATILHEAMHNHGYRHTGRDGDPEYEGSFPEIIGEAFVLQQCPDNSLNGLTLTSGGIPRTILCNTN